MWSHSLVSARWMIGLGLVEIFLGGGEADADTNEAGAGGVVRVERLRGFWGGTEVASGRGW